MLKRLPTRLKVKSPVTLFLFILLSTVIASIDILQPWQQWHSPLNSIAITRNLKTNLTTLYPRLDKIVGKSMHMYGHYSPAELHLLSRAEFLHTTVVEIGAHIGALSAAISHAIGDFGVIISVEPNPYFADMAAANIALNSNARSVVLLSAASNVSTMQCLRSAALEEWQLADLKANSVSRFFAIRDRASQGNSDNRRSSKDMNIDGYAAHGAISVMPLNLHLEDKVDSRKSSAGITIRDALTHNIIECANHGGFYCDAHPLDTLFTHAVSQLQRPAVGGDALPLLSLIRIDAEGMDGAVIQGAMRLIRAQAPVVIFEAEYRDPGNLSHFAGWEQTMAEYSVRKGSASVPSMLLDMVTDVLGTASTTQALHLLLCEAGAAYSCYPALCPVR
jgi:hypothetical protein